MVAAIFKIRIINENQWFSFQIPIEESVAIHFLNRLNLKTKQWDLGGIYPTKKNMVLIDEEIFYFLIYSLKCKKT